MINYYVAAEELMEHLKDAIYITYIGHIPLGKIAKGPSIQGVRTRDALVFINNLGTHRPTKAAAIEMLEAMVDYFEKLKGANPAFLEFLGDRKFAAELVVFSGHMDFKVAIWEDGEIEWEVDLD